MENVESFNAQHRHAQAWHGNYTPSVPRHAPYVLLKARMKDEGDSQDLHIRNKVTLRRNGVWVALVVSAGEVD